MKQTWAVVVAAGKGVRMGGGIPKQYRQLAGASVLDHALRPLLAASDIVGVVLVLAAEDSGWSQSRYAEHAKIVTARGGATRTESVLAGLQALQDCARPEDWVLVHDAARPLLSEADLMRLRSELAAHPVGGLLGAPVADTLKRVDPATDAVLASVAREGLWRAFTPQMFRYGLLHAALAAALVQGLTLTDEASALEAAGYAPQMVRGSPANLKLTQLEDWALARRLAGETMLRIGHGYDAHRLTPGRKLVLAGVELPHEQGLAAHSDGDVAIHALCDALLGGAALGDIGQHFPDRDPAYAGIDSRVLLRKVVQLLHAQGLSIVNADLTLVAQAPRLAPHVMLMRERLAADLAVAVTQVNVKATTTEGMGFAGRREGIAAHAVALLTESRS